MKKIATYKDILNFMETGFIVNVGNVYYGSNSFNKSFNSDDLFNITDITIHAINLEKYKKDE